MNGTDSQISQGRSGYEPVKPGGWGFGGVFPICFLLFAMVGQLRGEVDPAVTDRATIEARIKSLSATPEAGEEAQKTLAIYQEVLSLRDEASGAAKAAEKFIKDTQSAPAELDNLTATNSLPLETRSSELPKGATLDSVIRELDAARVALLAARAASDVHLKETTTRLARQTELPELIVKNNSELASLTAPEVALASDSGIKGAEYQRFLARRDLLNAQGKMMEAERAFLEATPALFAAQGAMLTRKATVMGDDVDVLQKQVNMLRLAVASDQVARAREDVARFAKDPQAAAIAAETLSLAQRHGGPDGLSRKMATTAAEVSRLDGVRNRVEKQYASAKLRAKLLEDVSLGIDAATGRLLRDQRQALPSVSALRETARQAAQLSAQAQIDQIVLEDRYAELLTQQTPSAFESPDLNRLWKTRLSALRTLISDHRDYITLIGNSGTRIQSLVVDSTDFARFVDERLLWIPSTQPIWTEGLNVDFHILRDPSFWRAFVPLFEDVKENTLVWVVGLLPWLYLVFRRRVFRAKLKECGEEAVRRNCTEFSPTGRALFFSVLLAAPIPLIAWFCFARSGNGPVGVTDGLRVLAGFLSSVIFIRVLAHPGGMLTNHFLLEADRVNLLRKCLDWYIPVIPLPLFLTIMLPVWSKESSAGRVTFLVVVILAGVFFVQLLKPAHGVIQWGGQKSQRFAKSCYFLSIAVPVGLVIGAAIGYYASVQELRIQMMASVMLILLALFVAELLHRWILVSRRRFAVTQALARRAAAMAERDARETEPGVAPQSVPSLEEVKANAVKVVAVEEQTTRLVRAATIAFLAFGLAGIWQTAIPALSALDRITLWEEEVAPPAAGTSPASSKPSAANPLSVVTKLSEPASRGTADHVERITLQDLLVSIIILVLTIVAGRNIPGLIELMFFRHMHLKPGSSFAFTTSIRYGIVVCGVIVAFAKIGISWGNVQWIAAAITLGIGFGLQEIFANFVAGLIILFERPIRLGDVVTIAGVDGRVTQIRIRATTIRQFNNRELIVPNKEFITGQLVNWTLSDDVLRAEIAVGLAYGSDTELARELMLEAATANERVLADPGPVVVFGAFAASSLSFELRVFVGTVDDLLPVKTELHFAIDQAFRDAQIEIAFPQSDIRIVSLPPHEKDDESTKIQLPS